MNSRTRVLTPPGFTMRQITAPGSRETHCEVQCVTEFPMRRSVGRLPVEKKTKGPHKLVCPNL